MKNKCLFSFLLIFTLFIFLCAFAWDNITVLVDTDNNHVYEYLISDDILSDFAKDTDAAKINYENKYYLLTGKIENISNKGDVINIYGSTITDNHIICSIPKDLRSESLTYSAGASLGVYGKLTVDMFDKEIRVAVDKIVSAPSGVKKSAFFLLDGKNIDINSMVSRTLNNGSISYKIPSSWKGVEHSIVGDGIGTIDGYQYSLNQLPGSNDTVPESFFVCYFDNITRLENTDDKKETELIEKAIINNISGDGKGNSARTRNVNTYYGAKYKYFVGSYTDALDTGSNGYHVEYIFQKNGDNGLVMYLYVYKNAKHLSDVFFVTRFLEINS